MRGWKRLWNALGPGIVSGASDDDPSGITTFTLAGAAFGFGTLWTALFAIPLMASVQEACARLAMVTHKGLIQNLKGKVPRWLLWVGVSCFVAATAFNVGANLRIMAVSTSTFIPLPVWVLMLLFAAGILILQALIGFRRYMGLLKWLCLSLLAYVAVAFIVKVPWFYAVAATFTPPFKTEHGYWMAALFGTAFSPYLCIWQTTQEVEMEKAEGCLDAGCHDRHVCDQKELLYCRRVDIGVGTTFANVIAWFIMLAGATVLYVNGIHEIDSPGQLASVLEPMAGPWAAALFTVGIVGTGLMSIPVLAGSAAYTYAELLGWKRYGFSHSLRQAPAFYAVMIGTLGLGYIMMLFGFKTIEALVAAAVINAMISPFVLAALLRLTNDRKLMGEQVNGPISKVLLWTTLCTIVASLLLWILL